MNRIARSLALSFGLILGLVLLAGPLAAAVSGATIGTTATLVLVAPATHGYRLVIIRNQSSAATISCAAGNSSPAIGAAGSFDIPPATSQSWTAAGVVFWASWYCVASASATPVTVEAE